MFKLGSSLLALASVLMSTGACAMGGSHHGARGNCRVIGGEKLPASTGGAAGICAAIEKAVATHAPTVPYSAEVRVLSKSALAAKLVANGRNLPEQNLAVSDRDLSAGSIERFARSLAEIIARAPKA
jgi:hypothetical protein